MIGLIYEWEQTADFITVNVQLPVGISGKLAEIKIGENILNVSLPGNYLLRIYLFGLVIRDSSKVIIKPGNITVNLKKKCDDNWSQLEHEDNKNKRILTEKYQELLKNEEIELEEKAKQLRIDKREQKDKSVGSQLTKEQNKRELREQFKENEKLKLSKEIERKKEAELEAKKKSEDAQKKAESKNISFSDSVPSYRKPPGQVMTGDAPIRKSKMAPPRNRGKIQIKFTERAFPTPVRESKRPEEEEWLQKQAKARKAAEDFENDLEPHEKEVGYLEDKGIKMMKNGDVEGALNAFNIAIKLFPSNPMLFMHRAAANLKFGNAIRAAQVKY